MRAFLCQRRGTSRAFAMDGGWGLRLIVGESPAARAAPSLGRGLGGLWGYAVAVCSVGGAVGGTAGVLPFRRRRRSVIAIVGTGHRGALFKASYER